MLSGYDFGILLIVKRQQTKSHTKLVNISKTTSENENTKNSNEKIQKKITKYYKKKKYFNFQFIYLQETI